MKLSKVFKRLAIAILIIGFVLLLVPTIYGLVIAYQVGQIL